MNCRFYLLLHENLVTKNKSQDYNTILTSMPVLSRILPEAQGCSPGTQVPRLTWPGHYAGPARGQMVSHQQLCLIVQPINWKNKSCACVCFYDHLINCVIKFCSRASSRLLGRDMYHPLRAVTHKKRNARKISSV